jgi:hypothetical protein
VIVDPLCNICGAGIGKGWLQSWEYVTLGNMDGVQVQ